MNGKKLTAIVIVLTVLILSGYDVWIMLTVGSAATISWVTWTTAQQYPVIPFAMGVLCGHLFWVQQTGREPRFPDQKAPK